MQSHYNPYINRLIQEKAVKELRDALKDLSPFEVADMLLNRSDSEQSLLFNALPHNLKLHTFDYTPVWLQAKLLNSISSAEAAELLIYLSPDDRTSFLQELPRDTVDELIKLLPHNERMLTLALLGYPENSIGRLMTPNYIAVEMHWSVEQVFEHIQHAGHDCETMDYIYAVEETEGLLEGIIKLRDLLFAPREAPVSSIASTQLITLSPLAHDETAIETFNEHSRIALPVVDDNGIMLGIVTMDDILRLSNEEATEDIQKLGGLAALDEPYLQAPFMDLMQKRAGWLITLFIGEMFTATAMSFFEDQIAKAVVLAVFLPLIISSGGNAGSQASTLVIRAMSLGEVKVSDWWKIFRLEILSGLFLGGVLGCIGFFRISVWHLFSSVYGEHWALLGLAVGLSLIGVVLWGSLIGALFPLLLRKIGLDPAVASAPCVATIVDVTGLIIYFLISIVILGGTLL